jgi:hypothetical protein
VTIAAVADDEETLRLLLALGASAKLRQGNTPLALAWLRGYREMVLMLERAGAR